MSYFPGTFYSFAYIKVITTDQSIDYYALFITLLKIVNITNCRKQLTAVIVQMLQILTLTNDSS